MDKPLQVLVVDDSALMRSLISQMLKKDSEIEVAAIAMNGQFAHNKLAKYDIDVITLDLEMPVMNGLEFLKERQRLNIDIPVIVFSSIAQKGARITMEALNSGASDFILKPAGPSSDVHKMEERLISLVKVFGKKYRQQKKQKSPAPTNDSPLMKKTDRGSDTFILQPPPPPTPIPKRVTQPDFAEIIAIGVSTGGPNALRQILPDLDENLPLPILIVQHMPPGFTAELAKSLDRICPLEVKEAKTGDIISAGRILIAPGGYHLTIEKKALANVVKLTHNDAVNGHRPSVDVLFSSVADIYHSHCIALIMTGMGKDGAAELGRIYQNGGITIAQEESSCIVPGMPGVAIRNGVTDYIIPLEHLARNINGLAFKYGRK